MKFHHTVRTRSAALGVGLAAALGASGLLLLLQMSALAQV